MKTIETQIEINADRKRVWAILTDFASYPNWNPFITNISGNLETGSPLRVTIAPPGARKMKLFPRVSGLDDGFSFRWTGVLTYPFIFQGVHSFSIEETDSGVRFHHSEEFSGLLVPFVPGILDNTKIGFEQMNQALKARAESKDADSENTTDIEN